MQSVELKESDLRDFLDAERKRLDEIYPKDDVPDDPLLFLNKDLIPEGSHGSIVYEDDFSGVALPESSVGDHSVPDNHDEDSWKIILEDQRRKTLRHELTHICYRNHHLGDQTAPVKSGSDPSAAYLEAVAMWEETHISEPLKPFNLEEYGAQGLEDIPEFWDRFIADKQNPRSIDDPHRFGTLSAYLIERGYLENHDLKEAKKRTRRDLLNVSSNKELEQANRQAAETLSIPYFPDLIRGRTVNHLDSEIAEVYLSKGENILR
ncbi:MAG: hypothetical protein H8Z69_02370 [Nanohaloarchaea archaeon]|nr:hypothetical protein [Candidatus Nanohaloarchaea archaeon]